MEIALLEMGSYTCLATLQDFGAIIKGLSIFDQILQVNIDVKCLLPIAAPVALGKSYSGIVDDWLEETVHITFDEILSLLLFFWVNFNTLFK